MGEAICQDVLKQGGQIICELTGRRMRSTTPGKGWRCLPLYIQRQTCFHREVHQFDGAWSQEVKQTEELQQQLAFLKAITLTKDFTITMGVAI